MIEQWIQAYEQLWRTAGTDRLGELFAPDARYSAGPWEEPVVGLDAIAKFWDAERDGPDESFAMMSEVVAEDGPVGVVRVEVAYEGGITWRDIWIVRFDDQGRCSSFEEWPFAPPRRAKRSG